MTDHSEAPKLRHIVHLQVIYPSKDNSPQPSYTADGKIKNQVEKVSLEYGNPQFYRYLKAFPNSGYLAVEVKDVYTKEGYMHTTHINGKPFTGLRWKSEVPASDQVRDKITKEIQKYLKPTAELIKSPDQKTVEDLQKKNQALEERLAAIEAGLSAKKTEEKPAEDQELEAAREHYKEITGKAADKRWGAEKIETKIAEYQE